MEAYEKTDEKARDLLRRLANSEPYYKKQRRLEAEGSQPEQQPKEQKQSSYGPGPIRTADSRKAANAQRGPRTGPGGARVVTAARPPQPEDWLPPSDPNITSLFVTGVEDDLPEHAIRTFFTPFGQIRSIVCSHRAHCAFINYAAREGAEAAAVHCQGKAAIQGCPLRIKWGKPKPLDNTDRDQRMSWAKEGREQAAALKQQQPGHRAIAGADGQAQLEGPDSEESSSFIVAPPPGQGEVSYASLAGD